MADEKKDKKEVGIDPVVNEKEQEKSIREIRAKEEEEFVKRVAAKFGLPYVDLSGTVIDTDALVLVPEAKARVAQLAPFKIRGKELHVAVRSPNIPEAKKVIEELKKEYDVIVYIVSTRSLEKAWARYADVDLTHGVHGGLLDIDQENIKRISQDIKTNKDIAREAKRILESESKKKVSELLELIFGSAIATKTSDIHFEPQEEQVRVRFRQDGVLQEILFLPYEIYNKLLARMKLLSKMKITQTRNAQDGRFTIDFDGKEVEVRVSVMPSAYGEAFVMRILNPDGINVGLEKLGIEPHLYEILLREINKPNGMILTTGPTGSGKTTTLYSVLKKVYTPEVKILTIEDPIEYHLEGIEQTQVDRDKGYDFLAGLRAALRHDPDIIMVGEIRDNETATIAVNASLTGHLVLSTLHTNSAAGVIPRLIDLGINPKILAAALSLSLAQRLVRTVCKSCAYTYEASEEEKKTIRAILQKAKKNNKPLADYNIDPDQETFTLTKGKGCEVCNGTGYKGRIGIFEAIVTDELVEELLNKKPSEQEVRRIGEKQGLFDMREDGVVKVLRGLTTLEEVQSVVDLDIANITKVNTTKEVIEEEENKKDGAASTASQQTSLQPEKQVFHSYDKNNHEKRELDDSGYNNIVKQDDLHREIRFLIDYLHMLETEQKLNPDIDASEKIRAVKDTIISLIEREYRDTVRFTLKTAVRHLDDLHEEQQKNPKTAIGHRIQKVREDIESVIKNEREKQKETA